EGVDLGDTAELKNFGARPLQGRCTGRVARQFETEIDFYRGADIRGPAFVDTPAPIPILLLQDVARGFREPLRITCAQHGMQNDVVGFERGVRFELATPVAILVLLRKEQT